MMISTKKFDNVVYQDEMCLVYNCSERRFRQSHVEKCLQLIPLFVPPSLGMFWTMNNHEIPE
jgi:hypothetical protein